ncbi:MAG: hypothetical protein EOO77_39420 [Oxalobacteraceae bacterium]|nr:MAG: hypothetical protein EOO77_39420 [Oxalobacteraceae bacterium]
MRRAEYQHRLFFCAIRGLIGRDPDQHTQDGQIGVYRMIYYPVDQSLSECRALRRHLPEIREWLDHFDVLFSKTQVIWGENPYSGTKGMCLYIEVTKT